MDSQSKDPEEKKSPSGKPEEAPPTASDRFLDRSPTDHNLARLDRHWLSSRSKEELVDIAIDLKERLIRSTTRMGYAPDAVLTSALDLESDTDVDIQTFRRVPADPARERHQKDAAVWRLVLLCLDKKDRPLALEIHDDVFVGRTAAGLTADVDLSAYDAERLGVSRQHALLRPNGKELLLIDLDSTNGTYWNARRLATGKEQNLLEGDRISFANLHFVVKRLSPVNEGPASANKKPLSSGDKASQP